MRATLAIALCCALPMLAGAQVYECPGQNGPVFTDQPCEGGKQLHLPAPNVIETGKPAASPPVAPASATPAYVAFSITSPEEEGTVHSNTGSFSVILALDPDLREGDVISLSLDGTALSSLRDSLEFDISSDEWQSAATADQPHVLAASVLDAAGKTLIAATPVRFYVQRATVRKRVGPR